MLRTRTQHHNCDTQSWAYKLVVATFCAVLVGSLFLRAYQIIADRGVSNLDIKETMKDVMLVLGALLARSSTTNTPSTQPQPVQVEQPPHQPIPVRETDSHGS